MYQEHPKIHLSFYKMRKLEDILIIFVYWRGKKTYIFTFECNWRISLNLCCASNQFIESVIISSSHWWNRSIISWPNNTENLQNTMYRRTMRSKITLVPRHVQVWMIIVHVYPMGVLQSYGILSQNKWREIVMWWLENIEKKIVKKCSHSRKRQ